MTEPTVLDPVIAMPPVVVDAIVTMPPVTFDASLGQAGMWTGHGPPGTIIGSKLGDEYLDLDSGTIYTLNPGP